MAPKADVFAFKNRRHIEREPWIPVYVLSDIKVLIVVEMEGFANEWQMNSDGEENQESNIVNAGLVRIIHEFPRTPRGCSVSHRFSRWLRKCGPYAASRRAAAAEPLLQALHIQVQHVVMYSVRA